MVWRLLGPDARHPVRIGGHDLVRSALWDDCLQLGQRYSVRTALVRILANCEAECGCGPDRFAAFYVGVDHVAELSGFVYELFGETTDIPLFDLLHGFVNLL